MNNYQLEKLKDYLAKAMSELLEINKVLENLEKNKMPQTFEKRVNEIANRPMSQSQKSFKILEKLGKDI